MDVRRALLAALAVLGLLAPAAGAQSGATAAPRVDPNALKGIGDLQAKQPGYRLTAGQVQKIADRVPKIVEERKDFPGSYSGVFTKGPGRWQVSYYRKAKPLKEIGQVLVDDASGTVTEAWTGYQVPWTMARGYEGAFGRKVNSPLVWIPLTVLFLAPFLTLRRLRMFHLDLVALAAFGISLAFFNAANVDTSVPIIAPLLAYLLARMVWIGFSKRSRSADGEEPQEALPLLVPVTWLAIGIVFLLGFRIGLNITNSNVIDVGYSGVIGADKLAQGEALYGHFPRDNEHGDTYGPVTYAAYIPFEQAFPRTNRWDDLPAAHAAAIAFDLACVALLFLIGRRLRGNGLGIVLAYLWVTWPFTLYVSNTNGNDSLVAALALGAVALAARPASRGIMVALGGFAKFGSLALAPLFATHGGRKGDRFSHVAIFTIAFLGAALIACLPIIAQGESLRLIYDRTLGFQAGRDAPFSIWGLYGLDTLQIVWQALAVGFAIAVAFLPRRNDVIGLCALAAAVLIAAQLGLTYWFYLYLVWFFPLLAIASVARYRVPDPA